VAPGNEEQKQTLCRGWEDFTFAMMDKPRSLDSEQASSPATRSLTEAGDARAQFSLGFCFASEGSAPDYLQAAQWYQKAADQRHALAQFNLGVMYDRGQGILRDPVQSMMWIGKAAQLGDAGAQYMLGMRRNRLSLAEAPEAALESRIEAYKWLQLAAGAAVRSCAFPRQSCRCPLCRWKAHRPAEAHTFAGH